MTQDRQIVVPASFIALYTPAGKARPTVAREWLEDRHDLCEDFATLLASQVKEKVWTLGITQEDALERVARALETPPLEMNHAESTWVMTRLHEILTFGEP
jgi:hypothetical protein